MKIYTVSGTRPDYLRLIPTIRKLDQYFPEHKLIWANQNFDPKLSTQFFFEFDRIPDYVIPNDGLYGAEYIGMALRHLDHLFRKDKPDCVLVLGDTNASFSAVYAAKRCGIPIFHMESGNRCWDSKRVPEEVNRYMIDSIADWHLCYTQRAREHLIAEGKPLDRIIVVGNPIIEAIHNTPIGTIGDPIKGYYLCTIHRKENIEDLGRLESILANLNKLDRVVRISNHPSFKSKYNLLSEDFRKTLGNIELFPPCNFSDFLALEQAATCVITDSGTVPEECYAFQTPCVLLRYSTERPELLEANAMILCDDPNCLDAAVRIAVCEYGNSLKTSDKPVIPEYHEEVSGNVVKILMRWNNGHNS